MAAIGERIAPSEAAVTLGDAVAAANKVGSLNRVTRFLIEVEIFSFAVFWKVILQPPE